ncbi:MAG: hypothetical protein H6713_22090 [Myxococcales bacterium]|nr:hypothetical protein [Myxococcales bacterium]
MTRSTRRSDRRARPTLRGALTLLGAASSTVACGAELDAPAAVAGLQRRAQIEYPIRGAHLVELAVYGEHVYVGNSFDTLGAARVGPDGALELTLDRPPATGVVIRCTTLAIHAPTETLYCASDRGSAYAYDLADPAVPRLRKPIIDDPELHVRDLHVDGDRLLLARFDDGLWFAEIAADGDIGEPRVASLPGNIHHVAADGGRVLALAADGALTRLAWSGVDYEPLGALALDGPALDLSLRGDRVAVALGSAGAVVVQLSEGSGLALAAQVRPPTVVTSADLDGDALATVGLSGVFLYDLATTEADAPRVAGFIGQGAWPYTSAGAAVSGRFVGGDLIVSDWTYLDRIGIELSGDALELDLPGSVYGLSGAPIELAARNPGGATLRLSVSRFGEPPFAELTFGPGEEHTLTLPREQLPARGEQEFRLLTRLVTPGGDELATRDESLLVVLREADGEERPAPGQGFPAIEYADQELTVHALPTPGGRVRAIFHSYDCAAMWPVILDAAWLARRGALDGGARPVLLSAEDVDLYGFPARWGIEDMARGHYRDAFSTPAEVLEHNAPYEDLYDELFLVSAMHSGAAHPTDYLVDANGVVEAVEREYRGAYPLR